MINTCNISYSTTSATHYKEKLFSDGRFLHATIKDADQCISCTPIKPNNFIHIKCGLGFFYCPEYNITDEELDDGPNAPLIHFIFYIYQEKCEKHVIIPNGTTLCKICEANDDINNVLIKIPTYGKKKHLTKCRVLFLNLTRYIINQF